MGRTSERFPLGLCGKSPTKRLGVRKTRKIFQFHRSLCLYGTVLFSRVYRYTKAQLNKATQD